MNEIAYKDWQRMIKLPSLLLLARLIDREGELQHGELDGFIAQLVKALTASDDRVLEQIFEDAIKELSPCSSEPRDTLASVLVPQCAVAVETARRILSATGFTHYCQTMAALVSQSPETAAAKTWLQRVFSHLNNQQEQGNTRLLNIAEDYFSVLLSEIY